MQVNCFPYVCHDQGSPEDFFLVGLEILFRRVMSDLFVRYSKLRVLLIGGCFPRLDGCQCFEGSLCKKTWLNHSMRRSD